MRLPNQALDLGLDYKVEVTVVADDVPMKRSLDNAKKPIGMVVRFNDDMLRNLPKRASGASIFVAIDQSINVN